MIGAPIVGPDVRAWAQEMVRYLGRAVINLQYLTATSSATQDGILMWDPATGGVVVSDAGAWVAVGGGGGGATDLGYTAATRILTSSTGADVTLPLVASDPGLMSAADKTKLDGVASGATVNSPDATLLARANHTGTQAAGTITGLATVATTGAYANLSGVPATFPPEAHSHAQSDVTGLVGALSGKQDTLVSATNIKTINGETLLGSGDLSPQFVIENRTSDPGAPVSGQLWLRVDL